MSKEKLRTGTWLLAVAACAVLAGATVANATPIRFDNPAGEDHYDWAVPDAGGIYLDLALPFHDPGQPPAHDSPSAASQRVQTGDNSCILGGSVWKQAGGMGDMMAVGVSEGTLITGTGAWAISPFVYFDPFGGAELPEGVEVYLPVAFDPYGDPGTTCTVGGDDCHYGWIGVVRTGNELDAFAWGYETEVGMPIAAGAPEPGTLAMLTLGALGMTRRRR